MGVVSRLGLAVLVLALGASQASAAPGDKARLTGLGDVAFGAIANLATDQRISQSVCAYSSASGGGYSITALGSGAAGEFQLTSGAATLDYEVEWADAPARTTGSALTAGVPLSGQVSAAGNQNCSPAPSVSASLIVVLRAAELGQATTGSYNGSLTLILAPL